MPKPSLPPTTPGPQCPKCSSRMEEGYLVDHWGNAKNVQSWVKGPPEKNRLTGGTKLSRRSQRRVETWRCTKCGYLESYAKTTWGGQL